MDEKPELIIFSQYKLGGVQNYFFNLINHDKKEKFNKRWIFTRDLNDKSSPLTHLYNICEEIVFEYGHENIYTSIHKLNNLLSDKPGLVLTNHGIELATINKHRLKNKTVVFFCHDEWYLKLASEYEFQIDVFIAHNLHVFHQLKDSLPAERKSDIYYLPYGINIIEQAQKTTNHTAPLRLIFVGRLDKSKGIYDIIKIFNELSDRKLDFHLAIIGNGPEKQNVWSLLSENVNVEFHNPSTTDEVLTIAQKQDIFILPSYLEGIPVALLEAMSVGLVPIIYEFNPGIKEVVKEDNGYIVTKGDYKAICDIVSVLDKDRGKLKTLSDASMQKIRQDYNADIQFDAYYELFMRYAELKKPFRHHDFKYDGKLDQPFIPIWVRTLLRKMKKYYMSKLSVGK